MFGSLPLGCTRRRGTLPAPCPHPPGTLFDVDVWMLQILFTHVWLGQVSVLRNNGIATYIVTGDRCLMSSWRRSFLCLVTAALPIICLCSCEEISGAASQCGSHSRPIRLWPHCGAATTNTDIIRPQPYVLGWLEDYRSPCSRGNFWTPGKAYSHMSSFIQLFFFPPSLLSHHTQTQASAHITISVLMKQGGGQLHRSWKPQLEAVWKVCVWPLTDHLYAAGLWFCVF